MSDAHAIMEIQQRMESARVYLRDNSDKVGEAHQVKEYDSDRRKQLLARQAKPFIANGDANAVAETKARSCDTYAIELDKLADQYSAAVATIKKYDAAEISFKSAQSLLSFTKGQMQL